ncbi:MAG: hypothetical protein D6702_02755 [Planctomycetota bacterium]|nr:MAG: hypothetical protein D6702_02755 [Planctomycetota bacterium]
MEPSLEVVTGRRQRRRFVDLARRFRGGSACYVPPLTGEIARLLDPDRNPALRRARRRLWIARGPDGEPRGRIGAYWDPRHAEALGEPCGWFGFFDADGPETTAALLAAARDWLREQGARALLGPADPDTNHECGCLIEGADEIPYLMMPHHPPEYAGWLEGAGLAKARDLLAFETVAERMREPLARLDRVADKALARGGYRLEPIRRRGFRAAMKAAHEVYNSAWRDNWGFLPLDFDEFWFEARGMKPLLDPRLAWLAWRGREPVGVIVALPDANLALKEIDSRLLPTGILRLPFLLRRIRRIRTVMLGVKAEHRHRGLDLALVQRLVRCGLEAGYTASEMSWVLEDNEVMVSLARRYGGRLSRRYRLYRGSLA